MQKRPFQGSKIAKIPAEQMTCDQLASTRRRGILKPWKTYADLRVNFSYPYQSERKLVVTSQRKQK